MSIELFNIANMSPPKHYETKSIRVFNAILKVETQKSIR